MQGLCKFAVWTTGGFERSNTEFAGWYGMSQPRYEGYELVKACSLIFFTCSIVV